MSNTQIELCILGSGDSIHTIKWTNYMAENGCKVKLLTFSRPKSTLNSSVEYVIIPKILNLVFNPFKIISLRRELKKNKVNLYQVHSLGSYGLLCLILKIKNFVATPWGSDLLLAGRNPLKNLVINKILEKAVHFTCDSFQIRDLLISKGVPSDKVSIINFGVDTNRFSKFYQIDFREQLGFRKSDFIILSTRSFEPIYDIETVIKAFLEVKHSITNAKLLLIGGGSLQNHLINLVDELNLEKEVLFIGTVENEQLVNYLNISDIYISSSLSDAGIAASTAEAMACENVCVISNVRENSKWIIDSVNGFLFEGKDYQGLAKTISHIYSISGELEDIKKSARATIIERNDYFNEMAKALNLYKRICYL